MGISGSSITSRFRKKTHKTQPRNLMIGRRDLNTMWYPENVIQNQKYNIITFIPLVLYEQFNYFLNLFFLISACTQFIPALKITPLYTYWAPLIFVVTISMIREAYDDIKRRYRDKKLNSEVYTTIGEDGQRKSILSSEIQVSDIIIIEKDQRVPADVVLLQTTDKSGTCFIRTDQLDGETDWKLHVATPMLQSLEEISVLASDRYHPAKIYAEPPCLNIREFTGLLSWKQDEGLNVENILWSSTVVATCDVTCCVIYTGSDTRIVMNTDKPRSKVGLVDLEINTLTKVLFVALALLSLLMMILRGFAGTWFVYYLRYLLMFSYMIPLCLRVNLDLAKLVYSWFIQHDKDIPGTVVRSSTIPEELGRLGYLLTDKTGTLTENLMLFKRIHFGIDSYSKENQSELTHLLNQQFNTEPSLTQEPQLQVSYDKRRHNFRRTEVPKVAEAIKAIALCHNVTPVFEEPSEEYNSVTGAAITDASSIDSISEPNDIELTPLKKVTYQASSPDEIALVEWTEQVGLSLIHRDSRSIRLELNSTGQLFDYEILQIFPFTSETKRMGIIVRDQQTNEIIFYLKGADVVMQNIIQYCNWLDEKCSNMAREGLRTLAIAKKILTSEQYQEFEKRLTKARLQTTDRNRHISDAIETIEQDMELLCITGVEDKLQDNVRQTLEVLRNAGIKIWMLTGDKLETAICIAKSSKLIPRNYSIHIFRDVKSKDECLQELNIFRHKTNSCLVITGDVLQICLAFYEKDLMELVTQCPTVVVCRCSPTQKANVVDLLKIYSNKKVRVGAIGDGGNDVSMIQRAHAGIGVVGKEGQQASLAADFSITQFSHLTRLLLVHGRNSYNRTAILFQFITHRGLVITVMQAIFSSVLYFATITLYPGVLLVGYATFYTMCPVFLLVLDKDVPDEIALLYPELYKVLSKGRSLTYKTFFLWSTIAIYQGGAIMYGTYLFFDQEFTHIVLITFTALIFTELIMIGLIVQKWQPLMVASEALSLLLYFLSLYLFRSYFDAAFLCSWAFFWRVLVVTLISCIPLYILKIIQLKFYPPIQHKLTQHTLSD